MSADMETVSLLVDAGEAKPSGALAPALGPLGLNLGKVIADINKETLTFKGMKVPVSIVVDKATKEYTIEVGLPPTSALVLNEIGLSKGGGLAGTEVVGNLTFEQVLNVAKAKRSDLLAASLKAAAKEVLGTTVSMGITTEGEDPRAIQKRIDAGDFDSQIKKAESN
ncbi:MAG: 50S ribosomal protein L11 [Candidatus Heimdallarchaeota archaeon LC_2]|nr:MAG: 50S ribosomal protein L11 [Candidatus Heimdallarchaeota archaeon LC_2]